MNQPLNLQERRRESAIAEIRVIQRIGIRNGIGKWVWQDFELSPAQAAAYDGGPVQAPAPEMRRQAPSMTLGRDPAKHLITIGKKFKNLTIEEADNEHGQDELYGYVEWIRGLNEPGPTLEVCAEMIEAYLIEREYDPSKRPGKYKNKKPIGEKSWTKPNCEL